MRELLFVYGTLVTGALEPAVDSTLRRHCRRRGQARVRGELLYLGDYPGAIKGDGWIIGELLELLAPQRCLNILDAYEGFLPQAPQRSLYLRERARAFDLDDSRGAATSCWIYWLRQPPRSATRIASGDWRRHVMGDGGADRPQARRGG